MNRSTNERVSRRCRNCFVMCTTILCAAMEFVLGIYACTVGAQANPTNSFSIMIGVCAVLLAIVMLFGAVACGIYASLRRDSGSDFHRPRDGESGIFLIQLPGPSYGRWA